MHFHRIFKKIAERGHTVVLLTTAFPGAPAREMVDGILVIRSGGDLFFQWTVARTLKKLDREFQFDVIYEDLNKLPLFTPFLTKKPHLIQIHHLWLSSIFREAVFPVALAVWFFERMIPFIYRKSTFVAVSPSAVKELSGLGVSPSRIHLIYNGADGATEARKLPQPKKPYFLWLSRVRKYKGIWVALAAFEKFSEKYPEVSLRIAGDGPEMEVLRTEIQKKGLAKRVILEGHVGKEKKQELLASATALLQTSFKEGWGLTVIEAGELGTVTIASNVSGLCDSVKHEKTGFLFPAGDAGACAAYMERVYTNPKEREQMELAAAGFASEYSWEKASRETEALLQKIILKNQ
jgi:glycosyltransferase involved in cell wall biosynthesis